MSYNYKFLSAAAVKDYMGGHTTSEEVHEDILYYQEKVHDYYVNIEALQEKLDEAADEVEECLQSQRNAFDDLEHAVFSNDTKIVKILENDFGGEDILSAYKWYLEIKEKIRINEEYLEEANNATDDLWHILEVLQKREGL